MAKNIYVGNLVWDATADDLLALFQEHGKVTRAQVITDRETGRSRCFGFVEMEDDTESPTASTSTAVLGPSTMPTRARIAAAAVGAAATAAADPAAVPVASAATAAAP